MKTKRTIVSSLLILGLLAGCGNSAENGQEPGHGHAAGHEADHNQGEQHAGHGTEQKAPAANLKASVAFASGSAKAKENTELRVRITDQNGAPVNQFDISHEKLLHLIIVNRDLSYFSHIHPEFKGDGTFAIQTAFPAGGTYKVFADFKPAGGSGTTWSEWVDVGGTEGEHVPVTPDSSLVKQVDDKEIELSMSGVKAKEEVLLTFEIRDAKTKEGINDLEPYLGAVGHVVILSEDAGQYLHVHPLDEKATGPKAQFATSFPKSGIYKIWGQFQHKGKVFTVPFVVKVN